MMRGKWFRAKILLLMFVKAGGGALSKGAEPGSGVVTWRNLKVIWIRPFQRLHAFCSRPILSRFVDVLVPPDPCWEVPQSEIRHRRPTTPPDTRGDHRSLPVNTEAGKDGAL